MKILPSISLHALPMKPGIYVLFVCILVSACSNATSPAATDDNIYLNKGDSIATVAQGTLLLNVMEAVKAGGIVNAVDFCSVKAMPLTDSLSGITNSIIQRLSDKNRNPANAIQSDEDNLAWKKLQEMIPDSLVSKKHFVSRHNNNVYYYKAITIAMPACLNCHGSKESDISPQALRVINAKYPADKATGYAMGALRGMWKIKMNEL